MIQGPSRDPPRTSRGLSGASGNLWGSPGSPQGPSRKPPGTFQGPSRDFHGPLRPSRDSPGISQDHLESLENTAFAVAGAFQGLSRETPGTPGGLSWNSKGPLGISRGSPGTLQGSLRMHQVHWKTKHQISLSIHDHYLAHVPHLLRAAILIQVLVL